MPISFRIDGGVLFLSSEGEATMEEWKGAIGGAVREPAFGAVVAVVHDIRGATRLLPMEEAKERLAILEAQPWASRIQRWAVVATGVVQVGMARWAQAFASRPTSRFRVFTEPSEAERWVVAEGSSSA
jgi:hypothetical protein